MLLLLLAVVEDCSPFSGDEEDAVLGLGRFGSAVAHGGELKLKVKMGGGIEKYQNGRIVIDLSIG